MLLRLAYLGVTNALALLRLLPMNDSAKDAEILALRHQITVLERHLHGEKIRFAPTDRTFLAALLHKLLRNVLRRVQLLVRPETVLRWHRDLITRRHAAISHPRSAGRPPTVRSIRTLVLRLATVTPRRVLLRLAQHQRPDLCLDRWAARPASGVGPCAGDQLTVPQQ